MSTVLKYLVEVVQFICILIPLTGIVIMLKKEVNKVSVNLLMANVSCLLVNGCYYMMLQSEEFEGAMAAMKIKEMGSALFYFFFIRFIVSYMQLPLPAWSFNIWGVFEMVSMLLLWNGTHAEIFFEEATWKEQAKFGFHYMELQNGLFTTARNGALAVGLCAFVIYTSIRIFRTPLREERNNLARLVGGQILIVASFSVSMAFKIPYDITPACSAIAVLFLTRSILKGELLSVMDQGRAVVFERVQEVFIILDKAYGYVDANAYAKELFPELRHKAKNTPISNELFYYFTEPEEEFIIDDSYFRKKIFSIQEDGKVMGYALNLTDETRDHQMIEALSEAKQRAEVACEARTNFMSNMSHEIRTPMNAIVGMTEIMLREEMPTQQKEYMENIRSSGNALLEIVNDILDYSKIESGRTSLMEEDYMPKTLLSDLRMILQNRIGEKEIDLIYDIDEKLPNRLFGDEVRVRQIILNICNNAIKFTQEGSVTLSIQIKERKGNQIELYFSIKDTGQGMHQEDLGKIFQSFEQVDTTKNRNVEGTGLGLAISKQLVELMGGTIGVRSEYGKGSEFYFNIFQTVPKNQEDIVEDVTEALNFIAPEAQILIADDNEMNRKVAKGLLEPLQLQMDFAENGAVAVEKIQKKKYHMVFMDHMMPIMDGIEATRMIRALNGDYYKKVPIVALSANVIKEARKEFFAAGMNDFVAKPIEMKKISIVLRKWLPKELIQYVEKKKEKAIDVNKIPPIGDLNIAEGVKNSGTEELFLNLLGDFYKLIDMKAVKIEKCLADEMIRDYTIEVHALKNTARMIGAMELSEMFYRMEQLGNAGKLEALIAETPAVLEKYRSYKEVLRPYAQSQEQEKREASKEEVLAILKKIRFAMDGFDLDTVDEGMAQLEECQLPECCMQDMEALRAYVADVAMEEVINVVDKMIGTVEDRV